MDVIVKPFGVNSQEALVEVIRRQQEAFFGDAYARKAQIKDKVSKVGIAYTMAHLTMLMGVLSNIYDHTEDWLTTTNPDGTMDFHDQGTLPVSEQEKRHDFVVRISDSSHTLGPFRLMVSDGSAAGDTFKTIGENENKYPVVGSASTPGARKSLGG
jgi:hypothetical protein